MDPISTKIGGLPWLSWVYDSGPWWAAIVMITADFVTIYYLMWLESLGGGPAPWERSHYKTFLWNDTIFIPLFMAMAVVILQDAPKLDGWYTQPSWHVLLLVAGFTISIFLEVGALKNGQYTMEQELSPSKLWHTFIFGIVFYWLASVLIPILVVHQPAWALILASIGFAGFVYNSHLDATLPFPKDAHLEGSWSKWVWYRREY